MLLLKDLIISELRLIKFLQNQKNFLLSAQQIFQIFIQAMIFFLFLNFDQKIKDRKKPAFNPLGFFKMKMMLLKSIINFNSKLIFLIMQAIIKSLEEQQNWKQFLKKCCRKNKIGVEIASFFTPAKIKVIYHRFKINYENNEFLKTINWGQNQLKAYHWTLIVISALKNKLIENFQQQEWALIREIFSKKDFSIIKYESIKLVNQKLSKNRNWNQQQTQILASIIQQNQNSNKWNQIARKLYQQSSHKFFRSGKQCRERWFNHLDPTKKKGEWDDQEDKIIIKYVVNHGRRWSNIAKQLGSHRTQHMVKNRFKTLIIQQKKLTPKILSQAKLLEKIQQKLFQDSEMLKQQKVVPPRQKINEMSDQNSQSLQQYSSLQISQYKQVKKLKRTDIIIPQPIDAKQRISNINPKNVDIKPQSFSDQILANGFLSHLGDDYSKGLGSVSTPMSSYDLQKGFSPLYFSYQGITPYLSSSPQMSFFVNTPINSNLNLSPSFSTFDNALTHNMFICPSYGSNNNIGQSNNFSH